MDFSLSADAFPPKSEQDFVNEISDSLTSCCNVQPKLVSLTCGTVSAAQHNSHKLLLALGSRVANPTLLVYLIQVNHSFKTVQLTARLGISKLLGDCYVSSQLRLDLMSSFRTLRGARRSSLVCGTTDHPGIHGLSARLERTRTKQALGCSCSLAQFLNFAEAVATPSVKSCLLSKLWRTPGFVVCAERPLNCKLCVECGVYIHNFVRRLILTGCSPAFVARAGFVYALAKLCSMISSNACWVHVFVLNKFRTLRKLV